jgi:hypothetical protein
VGRRDGREGGHLAVIRCARSARPSTTEETSRQAADQRRREASLADRALVSGRRMARRCTLSLASTLAILLISGAFGSTQKRQLSARRSRSHISARLAR